MAELWLTTLRGKEIVFTGVPNEEELTALCYELGARRVSPDLNLTTNVLVRGFSSRWKHGSYGVKEEKVAQHQAKGIDVVIIDVQGLWELRAGRPAKALQPHHDADPSAEPPPAMVAEAMAAAPLMAAYRSGQFDGPVDGGDFVFRDPEHVARGLQGHGRTADAFAELLELLGYKPLHPGIAECRFDLAYIDTNGVFCVCEVKSVTAANEAWQVRHGLGQVLDYAHWLEQDGRHGDAVRPLLILEAQPTRHEYWRSLCSRHGVALAWAPSFEGGIF